MSISMSVPLVVNEPGAGHAPVAPFLRLSALWIQITGTWCNLECTHCINASGPDDYTFANTSAGNKRWLGALPGHRRIRLGGHRVLMCHGSPRVINEFLWESATPTGLLERFLGQAEADVLACTHTGIKWHRPPPDGRHAVNVGVIGRPENDGSSNVWYTVLTAGPDLSVEFVPVHYDFETLADQIEREGLPAEFAETVRTGWWTTCLENLPSKERSRSKF